VSASNAATEPIKYVLNRFIPVDPFLFLPRTTKSGRGDLDLNERVSLSMAAICNARKRQCNAALDSPFLEKATAV
jgi:hypothetical protein